MQTEITRESIREYFYPSINFRRNDNKLVDYAEIELIPDGIKKLEKNLDRCTDLELVQEEPELLDPKSDNYEHIICYVHFDAGTNVFNEMFLSNITINSEDELDVKRLINEEEKQTIIEAAIESLEEWRNTDFVIDQQGQNYEVKIGGGINEK